MEEAGIMRTAFVLEDTLYEKLKDIIPQRKFSSYRKQIIKEKLADVEKKTAKKR